MDPSLQQLLDQPPPRSGALPGTLKIWDLREDYGKIRDNALSGGVEWGACVERTTEERLFLVHENSGTADAIAPACPPGCHSPYLGFVHVHLPMHFATGRIKVRIAYAGFSDRDYAGSLVDKERMSLVTNGDEVFALVRTERTPPITRFAPSDFADWEWRYDNAIRQAKADILASGATASDALNRRLFEVNEYLCQLLQFGFYAGRWGDWLQMIYQPK